MFPKRLKCLRRDRKMTRPALAALTNLTSNYIYLLEVGQKNPSFETIYALAGALDVSAAELMDAPQEDQPASKEAPVC